MKLTICAIMAITKIKNGKFFYLLLIIDIKYKIIKKFEN